MANTSSYTGGMLHGAAGLAGPQEQQDYDSVPVDELYGEDAQQQQQHSQPPSQSQHHEGGEGAASAELDDFMSHQLHQLLIKDMATFWANTVAPTTQSIAQNSMVLQQEARHLCSRADGELQGVMAELARVQGLVASFQEQIRETLSVLAG